MKLVTFSAFLSSFNLIAICFVQVPCTNPFNASLICLTLVIGPFGICKRSLEFDTTCWIASQYVTSINGMRRVGNVLGAMRLKDEMKTLGVCSYDVAENAIIRGLASCGNIENAILVLDFMLRSQLIPTVATFTTLMHICCKEGNLEKVFYLRNKMECCGMKLDVAAYNVLISGFFANCDVMAAFKLYEEMKQRHLWPNISIYTVLIGSLCDGNFNVEKEKLLKDLQARGLVPLDWSGGTNQLNELLIIARKKLNFLRHNRGRKQ